LKRNRKLAGGIAAAALAAALLCAAAQAADGAERLRVWVDGRRADAEGNSFLLDGEAYVPLREVSEALGATAVVWEPATATAWAEADGLALTVRAGDVYLTANGRYLYVPGTCILLDGYMMVPASALAKAFGAGCALDEAKGEVHLTSGGPPAAPASEAYDETDLYWLSRIIFAESGGESFLSQIAVGSVVMNRVRSGLFPDTVKGVIFDRKYGLQFTPVGNGSIYNTPTDSCVIAAKLALDGAAPVGNSLYFALADCSCWASRNRPFVASIGCQAFYA